jgi:glycine/D-amino acid oxidase-like deaminating enzyme
LSSILRPDFLIVGQGLAGTLISHFLIALGKKVLVMAKSLPGASSECAAGIINPVTGRRFAKSWRYDELFPFAKRTYLQLEELLGLSLWHELNIIRLLQNQIDENEWGRRSVFPEYKPYIVESPDPRCFVSKVIIEKPIGELQQCAQVAVPQLISRFGVFLRSSSSYIDEAFDYDMLEFDGKDPVYKSIRPGQIIFSEGAKAIHNPFFNYLPFSVTKGELLHVKIPSASFTKMIKNKVFIVPLQNDEYWVGSTSRFEFENAEPSPENGQWLLNRLSEFLTIPFEVISHKAAIRPTVFDIRPFLGMHPEFPKLAIFNGLGTKGALLGPYFAYQLADHLTKGKNLDTEVDIMRFSVS